VLGLSARSGPLRVLRGWPRRAAAALCFLLALASTLSSGRRAATRTDVAIPAGMVQTSAAVYADAVSFVRPGDRVDLVEPIAEPGLQATTPGVTVVARNVHVLELRTGSSLGAEPRTAQLLVAAPPDVATAIAAHQGGQVLAVTTAPP
jgi:hypothetical protein